MTTPREEMEHLLDVAQVAMHNLLGHVREHAPTSPLAADVREVDESLGEVADAIDQHDPNYAGYVLA